MKRPTSKFFLRILILTLTVVVIDQVLGLALERLYFNLKEGQLAETTYSIDEAKEDILIFGSSKAVRDYVPAIITKNLPGITCYNVGKDAERMPYYAAVQEAILARHKPRLIVVDILPNEFDTDNSKYLKLSALFPYYRHHPEFEKYIGEVGPFEKYKMHSKTYPFNSLIFIMISNYVLTHKVRSSGNGFIALEKTLTQRELAELIVRKNAYEARDADSKGEKIDKRAVTYFREFLDNTKRMNIKTLVVISPALLGEKPKARKALIEEIVLQYPNASFYDFSNDKDFTYKNDLFADMFHLNRNGAGDFSRKISKLIESVDVQRL